ncbi:MAG: DUF4276 family protein [Hymenobacter sp.]|nr:MAG: DUF4276 family protein [Hymenobacter sp.]
MSVRINITAEGQTEETFINQILGPHLTAFGKVVHTRRLRTIYQRCHGQPELINDNPHTAPSKGILQVCPGYRKIVDGVLILEEIGLPKLRQQCPHLDAWVTRLEQLP